MAEHEDKKNEVTGSEAANQSPSAKIESELPVVASPSISAAVASAAPVPAVEAAPVAAPTVEPLAIEKSAEPISIVSRPRIALRPRHKRYVLLAASVTFAAALGAVFGALASGGFTQQPRTDIALMDENKAMQQSIAKLGKEIGTLKTSLEQANKSANSQFAKISDRLQQAAAEITGSISSPQTTASKTPQQPQQAAAPTPLPPPRPQQVAAVEPPPSTVVPGWTILGTRNGYVYVAGHGGIYEASVGAPLPGLGSVQSVKRLDGRWQVQTPKGIIVSMRSPTPRYRDYDDF
jgi:hypothetical protein